MTGQKKFLRSPFESLNRILPFRIFCLRNFTEMGGKIQSMNSSCHRHCPHATSASIQQIKLAGTASEWNYTAQRLQDNHKSYT